MVLGKVLRHRSFKTNLRSYVLFEKINDTNEYT